VKDNIGVTAIKTVETTNLEKSDLNQKEQKVKIKKIKKF